MPGQLSNPVVNISGTSSTTFNEVSVNHHTTPVELAAANTNRRKIFIKNMDGVLRIAITRDTSGSAYSQADNVKLLPYESMETTFTGQLLGITQNSEGSAKVLVVEEANE